MKFKIVILLGLLFGFTAVAFPQSLHLSSFPDGASVTIDGVLQSKITPMAVSLTLGAHQITVAITATGWSTDTRTVNIVSGDNYESVTLLPTLTTGPPGPTGAAATIQLGTVSTGAPGSAASITNSGTPQNATLSFVIPAGLPGLPGLNGAVGPAPNISIGTVTTLPAGSQATATLTGTSPNYVLNIGIPIGATGAVGAPSTVPGPQGPAGPSDIKFFGYWTPASVPYPFGTIVVRTPCTQQQWATPPSCNIADPGPYMCIANPACTNSNPITGDPALDSSNSGKAGEWEELGIDPVAFVPAQVFGPISTTLSAVALTFNPNQASSFGQLLACFDFKFPSGSSQGTNPNPPCGGSTSVPVFGPGLGVAPNGGTFTHFTVTLTSIWGGSASGEPITGPLNVELLWGSNTSVIANCQIPLGGTTCTTGLNATIAVGDALGFGFNTTSGFLSFGQIVSASIPQATVTLTP